jgi:hypothetical protein
LVPYFLENLAITDLAVGSERFARAGHGRT